MKVILDRLWGILGVAFLISILPTLYYFISQSGGEVINELAVEYEYCSEVSSCPQQSKDDFVAQIISQTEYGSYRQVQWCLGVDTFGNTRVRRGGWIIGLMQEAGYLFCPNQDK